MCLSDGVEQPAAQRHEPDAGRWREVWRPSRRTEGHVGEPAHRLQPGPLVEGAGVGQLGVDRADHLERAQALAVGFGVPPPRAVELPREQRIPDASSPPAGMHATGHVDPTRVDIGEQRMVPAVRDQGAAGVAAEDGVGVGVDVRLVQLLVELVDAVPLARLVEVLDGRQQRAQLVDVAPSDRSPDQAVLIVRPAQDRQIRGRRGRPPTVGASLCCQIRRHREAGTSSTVRSALRRTCHQVVASSSIRSATARWIRAV